MTKAHAHKAPELATPSKSASSLSIAEHAFQKVRPSLDAFAPTSLTPVTLDLQAAAVVALGVARTLREPTMHGRVAAMAKIGVVDLVLVDDLEPVGWAAWYVRYRVLEADATHSDGALPAALVQLAYETRARMLRTLDYNLADDPKAIAKLDYIRRGAGHLDLANDLSGLAELYGQHRAILEEDERSYRASDKRDALELAARMLEKLGPSGSPELDQWQNLARRAQKLLLTHYEEAIRVGRFLFHYDNPEGRFPNLCSAEALAAGSCAPVDRRVLLSVPRP